MILADTHVSVLSEACSGILNSDHDGNRQNELSSLTNLDWGSTSSTRNTSLDSMGALYSQGNHISPTASKSSWSRVNSASDLSRQVSNFSGASTSSSSIVHYHWCTVCENPKAILKCDGWKRHMKEHETVYTCKAHNIMDVANGIHRCPLCSMSSPSQGHLDTHNLSMCAEKPRRYTRKINLVKHLELHGIDHGSDLADKWRVTHEKRFFACGFCVALFTTINEQLLHIDNHFKDHEDICNWDFNKVIKGLLMQPGVCQSWQIFSATYESSAFFWDPTLNKDLQLRLELSDEPSDTLALAAFNDSTYDDSFGDPDLMMLPSNELKKLCPPLPRQNPSKSTAFTEAAVGPFGDSSPCTIPDAQSHGRPFSSEAQEVSSLNLNCDDLQDDSVSIELPQGIISEDFTLDIFRDTLSTD